MILFPVSKALGRSSYLWNTFVSHRGIFYGETSIGTQPHIVRHINTLIFQRHLIRYLRWHRDLSGNATTSRCVYMMFYAIHNQQQTTWYLPGSWYCICNPQTLIGREIVVVIQANDHAKYADGLSETRTIWYVPKSMIHMPRDNCHTHSAWSRVSSRSVLVWFQLSFVTWNCDFGYLFSLSLEGGRLPRAYPLHERWTHPDLSSLSPAITSLLRLASLLRVCWNII